MGFSPAAAAAAAAAVARRHRGQPRDRQQARQMEAAGRVIENKALDRDRTSSHGFTVSVNAYTDARRRRRRRRRRFNVGRVLVLNDPPCLGCPPTPAPASSL